MTPKEFEEYVAGMLDRLRFLDVSVVGRSADGGIDIECRDTLGALVLVQCKRYGLTHPVGDPELQKFQGALSDRHARSGIFVTTSRFTQRAKERAARSGIDLIDGFRLVDVDLGLVDPLVSIPGRNIQRTFTDARGGYLPDQATTNPKDIAARGPEL